ncbi:H-type small acid-soluble spore protein [Clostridium sp. P21]|uniref:Small, acid-soluble spore protein H n=1 Tax=Clostridium muellerianum TaxID=2716538 RepID=A0A7Y0ELA5_9CLOT|nr:H-type small acid-soluble spore protein [Clostridium muellerianum]NMM65559.1 H-type small acid-soluble spore protein [Clostridium muellerianum]
MDTEKAIEIVESLGVIEVKYKGSPVWIEIINEQSNTAKVKDINTSKEFSVDITDLEKS